MGLSMLQTEADYKSVVELLPKYNSLPRIINMLVDKKAETTTKAVETVTNESDDIVSAAVKKRYATLVAQGEDPNEAAKKSIDIVNKIKELHKMGFKNDEKNIELLQKYNCEIERVVISLIT